MASKVRRINKKRSATSDVDESLRPAFVERAIDLGFAPIGREYTLQRIFSEIQHMLYAADIIAFALMTPFLYHRIPPVAKAMVTHTCVNLVGPFTCWHTVGGFNTCSASLNDIKYTINPLVFYNCEMLIAIACEKCLFLKNSPSNLSSFSRLKMLQIHVDLTVKGIDGKIVDIGNVLPVTCEQLSIGLLGHTSSKHKPVNFTGLINLSSLAIFCNYPLTGLLKCPPNLVHLDLNCPLEVEMIQNLCLQRISCNTLTCHVSELPRELEHLIVSYKLVLLDSYDPPPHWTRLDYRSLHVPKNKLPFHLPCTITELNPSFTARDTHGFVPDSAWKTDLELDYEKRSLKDHDSGSDSENSDNEYEDSDSEHELVEYRGNNDNETTCDLIRLTMFDLYIKPQIIRPSLSLYCFDKMQETFGFLTNLVHLDLEIAPSSRCKLMCSSFQRLQLVKTMRMTWSPPLERNDNESNIAAVVQLPPNLQYFQAVYFCPLQRKIMTCVPPPTLLVYEMYVVATVRDILLNIDWIHSLGETCLLKRLDLVTCYAPSGKTNLFGALATLSQEGESCKTVQISASTRTILSCYSTDLRYVFAHEFNGKYLPPTNEWGLKNLVLTPTESTLRALSEQ